MRHRSGIFALVPAVALALALTACRDGDSVPATPGGPVPPPPAPAPAPGDPPQVGTATPAPPRAGPPTREEAQAAIEENRRRLDEHARALLERFRGKVYDPMRDNGLRSAAGTAEIDVDGRAGVFRFRFDASKEAEQQVTVEQVRADAGLHEGAERQVVRFVYLATRGAYSSVLSYAPPQQYAVTRAADGAEILSMPPFQSAPGASYRFDARGLVTASGRSGEKKIVRIEWHWVERGGLHLLVRAKEDGGKAVTSYEYADEKGVTLLREGSIVEQADAGKRHSCTARLTWTEVATK